MEDIGTAGNADAGKASENDEEELGGPEGGDLYWAGEA